MKLHTQKAWKIVKEIINQSDTILEVLDSRMPNETRNKKIEKYIDKKGKELILVLNKADLVPEDFAKKVKELFEYEYPTVYVSVTKRKGTRALRKAIKLYSPMKDKIYIGVIGYPNTGKSSLINILRGRHVTSVAPIPGWTRGFQIIKLSRKFYLIDTPGVFPPENEIDLLIKGAIRPEKSDYPEKAAAYLIKKAQENCPWVFKEKYGIDIKNKSEEEVLLELADKFKIKGEEEEKMRKASIRLLNDWIKGKLNIYWL